jgi:hypothetical protein
MTVWAMTAALPRGEDNRVVGSEAAAARAGVVDLRISPR